MSGKGVPPPLLGNADHSGSKKSQMRARLSGEDRGGFNCHECGHFVRWGTICTHAKGETRQAS